MKTTTRQKVLDYVRMHPGCTSQQIKDGLQLPVNLDRIGMNLTRLRNVGLVNSEKRKDSRFHVWTAVDEDQIDDSPVQIVRATWDSAPARDPMIEALFGPARSPIASQNPFSALGL